MMLEQPSTSVDDARILRKKRRITGFHPNSEDILLAASGKGRMRQARAKKEPTIISEPVGSSVKPILKRRSSHRNSSSTWVRRISRQYRILEKKPKRVVRVNSRKNKVKTITPLSNKLDGIIRMPEYYVKTPDDGKPTRLNLKTPNLDSPQIGPVPDSSINRVKMVSDSEAKEQITNWKTDERQWYELARKKRVSQFEKAPSTNWSEAFRPQTPHEFMCNARQMNSAREWLEGWKRRLNAQKEEAKKPKPNKSKKRRRKVASSSSDENDADEWFNTEREELPNPFVIHGDCGTGKTSLIYCLADTLGFTVVEWSTSERRSGKTLTNKLRGLTESHNFSRKSIDGANIKSMFAAISARTSRAPMKTRSAKPTKEFSLLLLDDCDIIYLKDEGFWSTLKVFADESKVPIVLTCTDYGAAKRSLEQYEIRCYQTEHLNRCDVQTATKYLRATIFGWSNAYLDKNYIYALLLSNKCDMRKTINQLQFSILSRNLEAPPKISPSKLPTNMSFFTQISPGSQTLLLDSQALDSLALNDEFLMTSELESDFSLLFDLPTKPTTWRATESQDLNFVPRFTLSEQLPFSVEDPSPLFVMLKEYVRERRDPSLFKLATPPIHDSVQHARMRCVSERRIYCWRDVALDYLPCLSTINEVFRNRPKQHRRVQHPYDIVDYLKGTMIDATGQLKISIVSYPFPENE